MQLTEFKYFFRIRYLKKQFFRTLFCFIFVFSFSLSFAVDQKGLKKERDRLERMAKQGDPLVLLRLALMNLKGEGGKQDIPKAKKLFHQVVEVAEQGEIEVAKHYLEDINGSAEHQYFLGISSLPINFSKFNFDPDVWLDPASNIVFARVWFELSAEQGYPPAQTQLALMCLNGEGGKKDIPKAKKLLSKAAKQGNAEAQFHLGFMYYEGKDIEQNFKLARKWLEKVAKRGNAEAQFYLGIMYDKGQGVEKNLDVAKFWFKQSAKQGYQPAKKQLEKLKEAKEKQNQVLDKGRNSEKAEQISLKNSEKSQNEKGKGRKQDIPQTKRLLEKVANEQGNEWVQFYLGAMYQDGLGIDPDPVLARYWYELSAKQGYWLAQTQLALMRLNGEGEDIPKAKKLLNKAVKRGDAEAQFELALMYYEGKDIEQNFKLAKKWLEEAAKWGDTEAQFHLGFMYYEGKDIKQNFKLAKRLLEKVAKRGNAEAQFYLGIMYDKGQGVEKNLNLARYWFRRSAEQGYLPAQKELVKLKDMEETKSPLDIEKAAKAGDAEAQYELSLIWIEKHGDSTISGINLKMARYWLEKSAEQGYLPAQEMLASAKGVTEKRIKQNLDFVRIGDQVPDKGRRNKEEQYERCLRIVQKYL